jgi:hypothetical protein
MFLFGAGAVDSIGLGKKLQKEETPPKIPKFSKKKGPKVKSITTPHRKKEDSNKHKEKTPANQTIKR